MSTASSMSAAAASSTRPETTVRVSVRPLSKAGLDAEGISSAAFFAQRTPGPDADAMAALGKHLRALDREPAAGDLQIEIQCFRPDGPRRRFDTSISQTGHEVKHGRRRKDEDELIVRSVIAAFTSASEQYQNIGFDHTAVFADSSRHSPGAKQLSPSWPLANVEVFVRQMGSSPFAARVSAIGHASAATTLFDYAPERTAQIGDHLRQSINAGAQAKQGFHQSHYWNVQPVDRDRVTADYDLHLHLAMNTVEFSADAVRENTRLGKLYGLLMVQRDLERGPA